MKQHSVLLNSHFGSMPTRHRVLSSCQWLPDRRTQGMPLHCANSSDERWRNRSQRVRDLRNIRPGKTEAKHESDHGCNLWRLPEASAGIFEIWKGLIISLGVVVGRNRNRVEICPYRGEYADMFFRQHILFLLSNTQKMSKISYKSY